MQVIIFEYDGLTAVMSVATDIGLTIVEIGQKDVPAGIPFWVVDASTITEDYVIDTNALGEPSGIGGTYHQKQEAE